MADYTTEQLKQFSLNQLEDMYDQGRVSRDQMVEIAQLANETKGKLYWYLFSDGAFKQYDKDQYDYDPNTGKVHRIKTGTTRRWNVY